MRCPNCKLDVKLHLAMKVKSDKCRILPTVTSIMTVQCANCKNIFQAPVQTNNALCYSKDN